VPVYTYQDLFGSIQLGRDYELRMGANNVWDKGPPQIGSSIGTTDAHTYDVLGRSFYLGVKVRF
jgi:outer membrane receptor protein involved in Fe transport